MASTIEDVLKTASVTGVEQVSMEFEQSARVRDNGANSPMSQAETSTESSATLKGIHIAREDISWMGKLGNGAMCEVFKVEYHGKVAAAKRLFDKFAGDSLSKAYMDMVHEVNFVAVLGSHPNICEFHGFSLGPHDSPVLVMELIDGPTLEDHFNEYRKTKRTWRPKISTMYKWSSDILSALAFLHERPVPLLHRDLKPANLVLNMDRTTLKLVDFGVSRELAAPSAEQEGEERVASAFGRPTSSSKLRRQMTTQTGTSRYMSPEVFDSRCEFYDEKSDIFSAALVIWEICSGGAKAFGGKNEADMLIQQSFRDFSRPDTSAVRWTEIRGIIEAGWSLEPADRPSATELLQQLQAIPGCPPEEDPSPLQGHCSIQ